ncbi:hypothetical protein VV11_024140 [Trichodesmium erythraeum 21-75]|nr:hypothetical protein [Trichodesmium erythraeum 21-75]
MVIPSQRSGAIFFIAIFENGFFGCIFVGYCLVAQSLAPGAVAGSQCALVWAIRNAQQYNFNVEKIVVSRFSTGIHLGTTTGIFSAAAGFDYYCSGDDKFKVAGIVNCFGITDIKNLLQGTNV